MTEKIENAKTTEEETEPTTEQAQDKKPKVTSFTSEQQLQINSLLKREREKEEAKWKDLLTTKDTVITEIEGGLQKVIEVQTADFDPVVLSLLKDLPVMEQWKKLSDAEFVTAARRKNVPPKTPPTDKETSKVKQVGFGRI